jgi:uncharacterized Zn finger protein
MKALFCAGVICKLFYYVICRKNSPRLIEKFSLNYFLSFHLRGRKLNSHLERAIQKAMAELDKQSDEETKAPTALSTTAVKSGKGNNEKKSVNTSQKSTKSRMIKIAPAPSDNNTKK